MKWMFYRWVSGLPAKHSEAHGGRQLASRRIDIKAEICSLFVDFYTTHCLPPTTVNLPYHSDNLICKSDRTTSTDDNPRQRL